MQHPQKQRHTARGKESEECCQNSHFAPQYLKLSSPIFDNPSRESGCHSVPSPGNSVRKTTPVVTGQPSEGLDIDALTMPRCLVLLGKAETASGLGNAAIKIHSIPLTSVLWGKLSFRHDLFDPAYNLHVLRRLFRKLRQKTKISDLLVRKENTGPEIKRAGLQSLLGHSPVFVTGKHRFFTWTWSQRISKAFHRQGFHEGMCAPLCPFEDQLLTSVQI